MTVVERGSFSMQQGVQNPELMYRSDALPAEMRVRLEQLGYAPHAAELLMSGLPLVYTDSGRLVVEYPGGRRLQVERFDEYDAAGSFVRYRYRVLQELHPARR